MIHDCRLTLRRLRQSSLYAVAVVGMVACGLGTAASMVNVLYAVAWREVGVPSPASLLTVSSANARGVRRVMPLSTTSELERSLPDQSWCAYNAIIETAGSDGVARPAYVALLSGECPGILRVTPILGRWFNSSEVRLSGVSDPVVLISQRYWQRAFGGDPHVQRTCVIGTSVSKSRRLRGTRSGQLLS